MADQNLNGDQHENSNREHGVLDQHFDDQINLLDYFDEPNLGHSAAGNVENVGGRLKNEADNSNNRNDEDDDSSFDAFKYVGCTESLPLSDCDKENHDGLETVEFEADQLTCIAEIDCSGYDHADQIPLPELLKIHHKQFVSGFEFGEVTKRRAQENMKSARDKSMENRKNQENNAFTGSNKGTNSDLEAPGCSQSVSEQDHKTPHSHKRQKVGKTAGKTSDIDFCKTKHGVPKCLDDYPDSIEVWLYMNYKEEAAAKLRNPRLFHDFKSVSPRMRAILLDWLMEVSEVYHLRRVAYYLSVDYFDRFLSIRPDIPKSLLQLVGITCLYIAAKVEEIYPPNLAEFAYVCDGACKPKDIVSCEMLILNSLGWEVIVSTPSDWLNLYLQLHTKCQDIANAKLSRDFNRDFVFPQYSGFQFTRASQLIDLLSLDPGFLKFNYSTIAATAMYFMYGKDVALNVSGMTWKKLRPCIHYMDIFYMMIKDAPDPRLNSCLGGPPKEDQSRVSTALLGRVKKTPQSENYSFQTHVANMEYFEKATINRLIRLTGEKFLKPAQNNIVNKIDDNKEKTESSQINDEMKPVDNSTDLHKNALEDLASEDETKESKSSETVNNGSDNLLSLDEIFELILNRDDEQKTIVE